LLGAKASAELHTLYYSTPELLRDYPRLLKAILEEVNEAGCWVSQRLLEEQSVTSSAISSSVEELQRRSLERAILPLDVPTLESLQGQVNILHSLHLIPQRVNVRDGAYSIELRQNWTC
jgi:sulfonate transport system substrate-binding protein